MIKRLTVHGVVVEVFERPLEAQGEFDTTNNTIAINSETKLCPWRVLAHEISHAGLEIGGVAQMFSHEENEAICTAMEGAFGPLLKQGKPFENSNN